MKKEELEKLPIIKGNYRTTKPTQISLSLLKKIDDSVFENKTETLKKFKEFIMVDLDEDLEDYKYINLYINNF